MRYAFCVALLLALGATCLAAADVRCGAAAVNIEADDSMVIGGGIGPGKATGQEGELRAVAVVLEKPGGGKVAIVACDVLFVSRDYVDRALAEIELHVPTHRRPGATVPRMPIVTLHGLGRAGAIRVEERVGFCLVQRKRAAALVVAGSDGVL